VLYGARRINRHRSFSPLKWFPSFFVLLAMANLFAPFCRLTLLRIPTSFSSQYQLVLTGRTTAFLSFQQRSAVSLLLFMTFSYPPLLRLRPCPSFLSLPQLCPSNSFPFIFYFRNTYSFVVFVLDVFSRFSTLFFPNWLARARRLMICRVNFSSIFAIARLSSLPTLESLSSVTLHAVLCFKLRYGFFLFQPA